MADESPTGARDDGSGERTDEPVDDAREASPEAARGGAWLTYRYRFASAEARDATGTIKAPSFLTAARRLLARGLGATVGPAPAYLRLRAAGEQEVLFRVTPTGLRGADALRVEMVPVGSYVFPGTADPPAAGDEPPSAEPARHERRPTPPERSSTEPPPISPRSLTDLPPTLPP